MSLLAGARIRPNAGLVAENVEDAGLQALKAGERDRVERSDINKLGAEAL
jgi:hypothetical protein